MSINIQTENGLLLLADKTTKQTIEAALGYTPVKSSEIEDKYLSKADASYNYLLKGEAAAQYLLKGDAQSIYATLNDLSNYLAKEEDGDSFIITDLSGNIIFKVDKDGVHSVDFYVNGERVAIQSDLTTLINTLSSSVDGKIAALNASKADVDHNHEYSTISGAPNIQENDSDNFQIVDNTGNIAVEVNKDGLNASNLLIKGKQVALQSDVTNSIDTLSSSVDGKIAALNASKADIEHTHDYSNLTGAPNIQENESEDFVIVDLNGNKIVEINAEGLNASNLLIKGSQVALQSDLTTFENEVVTPALTGLESQVADLREKKADAQEVESIKTDITTNIKPELVTLSNNITNLDTNKANKTDVANSIKDINDSISTSVGNLQAEIATKADSDHEHDYTEIKNAPDIKEDSSGILQITDEVGRIAVQIDANGLTAAKLLVNTDAGAKEVALKADLDAFESETLNPAIEGVKASVAKLNTDKADNQQVTDLSAEVNAKIDQKVTELTNAINTKADNSSVEALTNNINTVITPKVGDLEAAVATLDSNKADKTQVNDLVNTKIPALESSISGLESTKATKDQVNTLESSINSTISGLNASIASLDANKADKEHEHDYTKIVNAPNISETETNTLQVTDEAGNIIMRVDDTGIDSVAFKVKGEAIEAMTDAEILAIVDEVFPPAEYSVEE